jgi:hypothetical protein
LDVTASWGAEGQRLQVILHSAVEVGGETENWKRRIQMEAEATLLDCRQDERDERLRRQQNWRLVERLKTETLRRHGCYSHRLQRKEITGWY